MALPPLLATDGASKAGSIVTHYRVVDRGKNSKSLHPAAIQRLCGPVVVVKDLREALDLFPGGLHGRLEHIPGHNLRTRWRGQRSVVGVITQIPGQDGHQVQLISGSEITLFSGEVIQVFFKKRIGLALLKEDAQHRQVVVPQFVYKMGFDRKVLAVDRVLTQSVEVKLLELVFLAVEVGRIPFIHVELDGVAVVDDIHFSLAVVHLDRLEMCIPLGIGRDDINGRLGRAAAGRKGPAQILPFIRGALFFVIAPVDVLEVRVMMFFLLFDGRSGRCIM